MTEPSMPSPPLRAWQAGVLSMVTFGTYLVPWLWARSADARKLHPENDDMSPPVVFSLAGLFQIFLPFAWPVLMTRLQVRHPAGSEAMKDANRWAVAGTVIFVGNATVNVMDRLEYGNALLMLAITMAVVVFESLAVGFAQREVHDLHLARAAALPVNEDWQQRVGRFAWYHWLVLVALFPVSVYSWYLMAVDVHLYTTTEEMESRAYHDPRTGIRFESVAPGLRVAEIGTHSDGSAILEFTSGSTANSVLIFDYPSSQSLDGLMQDRLRQMQADVPTMKCTERRTLVDETARVLAEGVCEHDAGLFEEASLFVVLETEVGLLEFVGGLSADSGRLGAERDRYLTMARSMRRDPEE